MDKVRKEFPVLRKGVYANTAVYGPMYDSLLDWRQEHDLDFLLYGSEMRERSLKLLSDTKTAVSTFFNCKRENVALVNNFSTGLNFLLEGLHPKKKILLLENDYPSLNWSFENRDFHIHKIGMTKDVENDILDKIKKENIDVLALSLVQWLDGFKINLKFLQELKYSNPNLIIIADGTQFCGSEVFDFDTSGIDVLGASAYKWMLSGYGSGFMLFSDQVKEEFTLDTIGFNAANGDFNKKDSIIFAKKFEPGHLSCLNFGSLKYSIEFMQKIGKINIAQQNQKLSQKAKEEFGSLSLLDKNIMDRDTHSTIFNIKANENLFHHLVDNNVYCAQRGEGIRLSFHFYNTMEDIDNIIRFLKTAK
ncbi:aminotransferase class V-fold PLP-dependent enzyme [Maribacter sp. CXY002]|uniref:aminotransferase class V-fold PLP-dependent enzyme n=1 Tax=Maribacter luteocoastalis TaxID=3407671 RepID=UPI003B6703C1